MSHAFKADGGTTFHYSSDMSGNILVVDENKRELYIPAQDVLDFVANYVRERMVESAKNMTTNQVLFGGEFSDAGSSDG